MDTFKWFTFSMLQHWRTLKFIYFTTTLRKWMYFSKEKKAGVALCKTHLSIVFFFIFTFYFFPSYEETLQWLEILVISSKYTTSYVLDGLVLWSSFAAFINSNKNSQWIFIFELMSRVMVKMKHSVRFQRVFILLISIINWRLSSIPIQWNENFFSFLRIHPRVIYNWATVFIVTTQSHFNIFCWMESKIIKHRLRFMISYFIGLHKKMFDIFIDLTKFLIRRLGIRFAI